MHKHFRPPHIRALGKPSFQIAILQILTVTSRTVGFCVELPHINSHQRPSTMNRHANTASRHESRPHHVPRPNASATATAPFCNTCAKLICERRSSASATLSPGNTAKIGSSSLSVSWIKRHWLCIHPVFCGTTEKLQVSPGPMAARQRVFQRVYVCF